MTFRNQASRPYSFYSSLVSYPEADGGAAPRSNFVRPNETKTYFWRVRPDMAPTDGEFDCKAWAYFSDVDLVSCGLRGSPGWVGGFVLYLFGLSMHVGISPEITSVRRVQSRRTHGRPPGRLQVPWDWSQKIVVSRHAGTGNETDNSGRAASGPDHLATLSRLVFTS